MLCTKIDSDTSCYGDCSWWKQSPRPVCLTPVSVDLTCYSWNSRCNCSKYLHSLQLLSVNLPLRPKPRTEIYTIHSHQSKDEAEQRLPPYPAHLYHSFNPSARVLGVILDKKLSWQPHLQNIKSKLATQTNVLSRLSASTWGASLRV
jgi:hypothetical protein